MIANTLRLRAKAHQSMRRIAGIAMLCLIRDTETQRLPNDGVL
ncbi:MAG: hypothetical protein ACREV5_01910 [Steroidobacter sp.]